MASPTAESKKPGFFYGYIIVIAGFLVMVITWGAAHSFGVFLKPMIADFGWTRAMASGAYSVSMFISGFFFVITGRLNDRFGPRLVITICGIFLSLAYLLMSQINALWQLYVLFGFMVAVGLSSGFVPLTSTVARWFVKRRGLLAGIVASGFGAGALIGPPVAVWLITSYGWRNSYFIIGIMALVSLTVIAQFLRRDPSQKGLRPYGESEASQRGQEAGGFSPKQALNTGQFWMFSAMYFCVGFGLTAVLVHIVPHATDLGISALAAANILAIIGGLNFVGRIGIGGIADRIGIKWSLIISFILLSVSTFSLPLARELWVFYLLAAILGFGGGGVVALGSPLMAELFGLKAHGSILGLASFSLMMGAASGPVIAGYIFDITDSYYIAFMLGAVLGVAGVLLASLLKPARRSFR